MTFPRRILNIFNIFFNRKHVFIDFNRSVLIPPLSLGQRGIPSSHCSQLALTSGGAWFP